MAFLSNFIGEPVSVSGVVAAGPQSRRFMRPRARVRPTMEREGRHRH